MRDKSKNSENTINIHKGCIKMSSKKSLARDATALESNINQTESPSLGITQEYDRSNYDNQYAHIKFKDKAFENSHGDIKKTAIDENGRLVYRYKDDAKARFGEQKGELFVADADHIDALKSIHERHKHNPFLSDADIKEVGNRGWKKEDDMSRGNFQLMRASENRSKKDSSDFVEGIKEGDIKKATKGLKAQTETDILLAQRAVQNAGREFVRGATDTLVNSAIPLTAEAARRLIDVAQGKESFNDAAKEMAKTTANVAIVGGTNKLLVDVVSSRLANSSSTALRSIAGSNQVAQIIAVAAIVQESAIRYINGEIDGKEFIDEVGIKGATMVAGMIGGQVGREIGGIIGATIGTVAIPIPGIGTGVGYVAGELIGQVLGVIITTVSCSAIISVYNTSKHLNDYKLKEHQILRLESDALKEMEKQRDKFREIVQREYGVWDETIQSGFEQILKSACEETYNLQGVTDGLDKILSLFGKHVKFSTVEEYESQLNMPLKLSF